MIKKGCTCSPCFYSLSFPSWNLFLCNANRMNASCVAFLNICCREDCYNKLGIGCDVDMVIGILKKRGGGGGGGGMIWNIFPWKENFVHWFKFYLSFGPKGPIESKSALVQEMLVTEQVTSHYLNQCWASFWCICVIAGASEFVQVLQELNFDQFLLFCKTDCKKSVL